MQDSNTLIAKPKNVIVHEYYNNTNGENNIALIELSEEFSGQYIKSVPIFTNVTISNQLLGLGFVSFHPDAFLKMVDLTQKQCQAKDKPKFCTEGTTRTSEACSSEFGGPLYDIQSKSLIAIYKVGNELCSQLITLSTQKSLLM